MFWMTKKSEGDQIELEQVKTFHVPKSKTFGNNTSIPTKAQKNKWASLTLPGKKGTDEWIERSKESRERILEKYGGAR